MERPTCKTCPYWEFGAETEGDIDYAGFCHRHAPAPRPLPLDGDDNFKKTTSYRVYLPVETLGEYWCGEHPDFPAYLESLKPITEETSSKDPFLEPSSGTCRHGVQEREWCYRCEEEDRDDGV